MSIDSRWVNALVSTMFVLTLSSKAQSQTATLSPQKMETIKPMAHKQRTYRSLTLDNELRVLLISDPTVNKSSAALSINVGSFQNPAEHLGLAHYLEHLLFLGTKKYPDPNSYTAYLNSNKGYSNAYTAGEETNYFFEVNHEGFEGAIDRFSRFFTEPVFNPDFILRELNAVNSEHQKNLLDDWWRSFQVLTSQIKKEHPQGQFITGSLDTLKNTDRSKVIEFYEKEYSANIMNLVMLSSLSLDAMEKLAKDQFLSIPNKKLKPNEYEKTIFDPKTLPKLVSIKPIKDLKELRLIFEAPTDYKLWESKPSQIVSHLIGHEGEGSLLSLLKKENLATGLSAFLMPNSYGGTFYVTITLTNLGSKNHEKVIEYFFSYIQLLHREGLKDHVFQELETMARLNHTYRDPEEGGSYVAHLASLMRYYPPLNIEEKATLFYKQSQEDFKAFLDHIVPSKLLAMYLDQSVKGDQKEKYYGTEFKVDPINSNTVVRLQKISTHKDLAYPKANPFIPKDLGLLSHKDESKPQKVLANEWGDFWFQGDEELQLPKASVTILLFSDKVNRTPKDHVLSTLYVMALNHMLTEWRYPISLAGLDFSIQRTSRGISLSFNGYADNIPMLMSEVAKKLGSIEMTKDELDIQKEDLKRSVINLSHEPAFRQALYQIRFMGNDTAIHAHSYFNPNDPKVDLISPVTVDELKKYTQDLFSHLAIEGAAYGNLKLEELRQGILAFPKELKSKPIAKDKVFKNRSLAWPKGQPMVYLMHSNDNNSAWIADLQFARRTPKTHALTELISTHLEAPFFGELRTNQQLGYIVTSFGNIKDKVLGLSMIVQSDQHPPEEVSKRAFAFIDQMIEGLKQLTDDEFKLYQESIVKKFLEKDKTFEAKLGTLYTEAITLEGQFAYNKLVADEVAKISKTEFIKEFKKSFETQQESSLAIYLYAKGLKSNSFRGTEIKDAQSFKKTAKKYE